MLISPSREKECCPPLLYSHFHSGLSTSLLAAAVTNLILIDYLEALKLTAYPARKFEIAIKLLFHFRDATWNIVLAVEIHCNFSRKPWLALIRSNALLWKLITYKLLGSGGIYKLKHNFECLLTHIDGLCLFTKLIVTDVAYHKNLAEEMFQMCIYIQLLSTTKKPVSVMHNWVNIFSGFIHLESRLQFWIKELKSCLSILDRKNLLFICLGSISQSYALTGRKLQHWIEVTGSFQSCGGRFMVF